MNKLSRFIYWVLIFCITFANFAFLLKPQKVKAAKPWELDSKNIPWYVVNDGVPDNPHRLPDPGYEGAGGLYFGETNDGYAKMIWKLSRKNFQANKYGESMMIWKGFRIKSGSTNIGNGDSSKYLNDCLFPTNVTNGAFDCAPNINIKVEPNVLNGRNDAGDPIGIDDWIAKTGAFAGSSDFLTFTLINKNYKVADVDKKTVIGVQSIGTETFWSDNKAGLVNARTMGDDGELSDAFSDDNIEKYILNKMSIYKDGQPEVTGLLALGKDTEAQQFFQDFMRSFKTGGAGRQIMVQINAPEQDQDVFKIPGVGGAYTDASPPVWQPLIGSAAIGEIRKTYFTDYRANSVQDVYDKIRAIREHVTDLADPNVEMSCTNLVKELDISTYWDKIYTVQGAVIGAGIGLFIPGGPATTIAGGVIGAGAANAIKSLIDQGLIDNAKIKLDDFIKQLALDVYSLNFMLYKEVKVGLEKFKDEGESLNQETGLNPAKSALINNWVKYVSKEYRDCFKDLISEIDEAEKGQSVCGINFDEKSLLSASFYLASALCGILELLGSLTQLIVDAFFTSIFEAKNLLTKSRHAFINVPKITFIKQNLHWI